MKVRVMAGRNKGEVGTVTSIKGDAVYVDFNRKVLVNEGFGIVADYPDGYWIKKDFIKEVDNYTKRSYNA